MDPFYLRSFWDLSTERPFDGGLIPWSRIREYGLHVGLDDDIIDAFIALIRAMDGAYLKWIAEQAERERQQRRADRSR